MANVVELSDVDIVDISRHLGNDNSLVTLATIEVDGLPFSRVPIKLTESGIEELPQYHSSDNTIIPTSYEKVNLSEMETLAESGLLTKIDDKALQYQQELLNISMLDEMVPGKFALRLQKVVADLFNKPEYSDLVILLKGGRKLHGHKLILSARSDEWSHMNLQQMTHFNLSEYNHEVATAVINWIYTDNIEFKMDDSFIQEMLKITTHFKLLSLRTKCEKFMISRTHIYNCYKMYEIAEEMSCELVKEFCLEFLANDQRMTKGTGDGIPLNSSLNPSTSGKHGDFICEVCGRSFTAKYSLKCHLTIHTGAKPYKCNMCSQTFTVNGSLKSHMAIHTGDKPFNCGICGKTFRRKSDLRQHVRVHTGDKPYKCEVCGRAFTQVGNLRTHMRSHTGEKPFMCDTCGKKFAESSGLKAHMTIHSGDEPYKCDECGKTFSGCTNLNMHYRTHTGDRPCMCDICGKSFSMIRTLKSHKLTHFPSLREKSSQCDVCGKTFNTLIGLRRHKTRHTSTKSYPCDLCNKSFKNNSSLRFHKQTHSGITSFECHVCGKGFRLSSEVKSHFRIHTGEKCHECHICGKTYIYNQDLVSHVNLHTGEKNYPCSICGKNFNKNRSMLEHKRRRHPLEMD